MAITYKGLSNVTYPAFRLPIMDWEFKDGLLIANNQIIDDTNMPGASLGVRRLQTPFKSLFPLEKSYDSPIAVIKETPGTYIDSIGKIFIYEKTIFSRLKYYKIKKIDKKITYSILWLHRVNFPIKIPRPPTPEFTWAGMLHIDYRPWLLYGYATEKLGDTRRKI